MANAIIPGKGLVGSLPEFFDKRRNFTKKPLALISNSLRTIYFQTPSISAWHLGQSPSLRW